MTGYDEELSVCSGCKKDIVVAHYGCHPAYSILCPDCTTKAKETGKLDHLFKWKLTGQQAIDEAQKVASMFK